MPELPEVETTRRGIAPAVVGRRVTEVVVRNPRLRWPVPASLASDLVGQVLAEIRRRGKYLLLHFDTGTLILHLGMSGHLRLLTVPHPADKHDHFDIVFDGDLRLRLHDPRRFGSVSWTREDPLTHPLLAHLGVEPLEAGLNGAYLYQISRGRTASVKSMLMDSRIVVGIGNIYANEALFLAGISPTRLAGRISLERYERMAAAVKEVLQQAIAQGGTTLRDFFDSAGRPGYFDRDLKVYGRERLPCWRCGDAIRKIRQGQRSSYYCPRCQRA